MDERMTQEQLAEIDAWLRTEESPWDSDEKVRPAKYIRALLDEVKRLKAELEHERLRLAACGVAALGYTNDAGGAESASFDEVVRLRARAEKAERHLAAAGSRGEGEGRVWGCLAKQHT
ncbi:hypothetical protein JCM15519_07480 [Fundidesulfovibrio butyratiphilus]